ncbi:MAG: UDP-N-acetylmuramoyl-tripeptide--D-alanyl-D-alanine ligase [Marinilabiliaceae bacterium]|nr:UDP-N-acetylmuramoyl-tripeptide--D-alanyl-D-alanine ligase [Marinilabiliaceae bacterium]
MEKLYEAFKLSTGICTDTRTILPGCMFIALKGENFDANTMVNKALEAGAKYVVTNNSSYLSDNRCFVVENTLHTLQQLASYHRDQLDIPVVAITGTNGKTTTKELTAAVLAKKYHVLATQGNLNNHIGVPLTLLSISEEKHDIAVVEMGANHPGEIAELAAIVKPTSGLITNVGIAHTLGFGSFEGVKTTKKALYEQLIKSNGKIFINACNEYLVGMLGEYDNILSYGTEPNSAAIEGHLSMFSELLTFEWLAEDGITREVSTHLTGAYNIENALAAISVGSFYDVNPADICEALSEYVPKNGRSQVIQTKRNRVIMDAYNANPTSMMASVENFAGLQGDNKIVILGGMRELGSIEAEMHRNLLSALKEYGLNEAYLVGNEFTSLKEDFPLFHYAINTDELTEALKNLNNAYILVKGSHSNRLDKLADLL